MHVKVINLYSFSISFTPLPYKVTLRSFDDDPISHIKPPEKFDEIGHMVEWLILVESKMQPRPLSVGDTSDIKRELEDLNVKESKCFYYLILFIYLLQSLHKELSSKKAEYHLFMKSSRHSDHSDSSGGSSPTQSRGESPPKMVKFVDENTIERHQRRKQIEQDNILETIISEDELEVENKRGNNDGMVFGF